MLCDRKVILGNTVKDRVIAIRKALGLTQRAISKGIYVSQSYYANIEQGSRPLNDRVVALLCSQYGVSIDYLLNGNGDMFSGNLADIQLNELLEIFDKLNPLFRNYILLQVKSLYEVQQQQGESLKPAKKSKKP
jgi:transcriptional regulator with XRE-family HTH domain